MDSLLSQLLPAYDFRTRYTRRISARPAQVWTALETLAPGDLPVTRLLMAVRAGGRSRQAGPVIQSFGLPVLRLCEPRELAVGKVAKFWRPRPVPGPESTRTAEGFTAFAEPGWAKAAMSFQLTELENGQTLLAAETRVRATGAGARRLFAPYWLLIRAGGAGFIRLEMLRAIARRAESAAGAGVAGTSGSGQVPGAAQVR